MKCVINDYKVDVLPVKGVPNSRYYVPNGIGDNIDEYVTDKDGNFHKVCCADGSGITEEVDPIALAQTIELIEGTAIEIIGTPSQTLGSNPSWEIHHGNTSSVVDLDTSAAQVIDTITFDTFGHVQTITTRDLTLDDLGYVEPLPSGRFGFAGEDDSDTGERIFNFTNPLGPNDFTILANGTSGDVVKFYLESDDVNVLYKIINQVAGPIGNAIVDFYADAGTTYWQSQFFGGAGSDVLLRLSPGFVDINLDVNSLLRITGVTQDDNSTQLLAVAPGGEVFWVDKGTITAGGGYSDEQAQDAVFNAIVAGAGIDIAYNDVANTFTITHEDTSSVANLDTSAAQVIDTLTFDTFGHVQTVTTRDLTLTDLGYTVPNAMRFGFPAEDVTATENRAFNITPAYSWEILNTTSGSIFGLYGHATQGMNLSLYLPHTSDGTSAGSDVSPGNFGTYTSHSTGTSGSNFYSNSTDSEISISEYHTNGVRTIRSELHMYSDAVDANSYTELDRRVTLNTGAHARFRADLDGAKLQAKSTSAGTYKGILVKPNTDLVFENYPSTRADASASKAFYSADASGTVAYGPISSATGQRFGKSGEDVSDTGYRSFAITGVGGVEFKFPDYNNYFGVYSGGIDILYNAVNGNQFGATLATNIYNSYVSSNNGFGNFNLSSNAGGNSRADMSSQFTLSGNTTVSKLDLYSYGTDANSYAEVHRQHTNDVNGRFRADSAGAKLQTRTNFAGTYKGLLVKPNSDFVFENYPSSRADAGSTKAFYAADASGTVAYGPISSTTGQRFGVAGEDAVATQNRIFDAAIFYMEWNNVNDWVINTDEGSLVEISNNYFSFFTKNAASTQRTHQQQSASTWEVAMDTTNNSYVAADGLPRISLNRSDSSILLQSAKIQLTPTAAGTVLIDNLPNLATQNRLIGQFGTSGQIGYVTLGTGLSMTSGVLNPAVTSYQRFGKAGEDTTAAEDRTFSLGSSWDFRVTATTGTLLFQDSFFGADFNDGGGYKGNIQNSTYSIFLNTEETGVTYNRFNAFYDFMDISSVRNGNKAIEINFNPSLTDSIAKLDLVHNNGLGANSYGSRVKLRNNGLFLHASATPNTDASFKGIDIALNGGVTVNTLSGGGDVIVGADNTGLLTPVSYADVVSGGQVVIFEWKFSTSVGVNNPGSTFWRADSVVAASVATLSIADITNNTGIDISALFALVDGDWLIHIQQSNDATKFIQFTTSGTYIDHTTWWEVPVTYVQDSGFPFANNTKCTFVFVNQNAGGGGQNLFETIAVAGQNNVVADSPTDTLTLVAGTGMTITTDDTTDTITFTAATSSSGIVRVIVSTSGSITLGSSAATDYVYFVTGAHTMSMPTAVANTNRYTVKNNHSSNITIDTAGAENIEGVASISIAPESSVDIISNGTDWFII